MDSDCPLMDRSSSTGFGRSAELLNAKRCSSIVGISLRSWWRLNSAGKIPAAMSIGRVKRWRARELELWIEAGCPDRAKWELIRGNELTNHNGR
jgi:predicted DNA-binding transcriptional regulator AlpA